MKRWLLALLAGLVLCAGLLLVRSLRTPPPTILAPAPVESPPAPPPPASPPARPDAASIPGRPPATPDEAGPPVDVPKARPLSENEKLPKRRRGIELLAESIARLELRLREAERTGPAERASELRVELERLRATKQRRERELQ